MSKLYAANTQAPEVCLDADDSMKKELGGGTFTVQPGDTLWGIAQATYGNGAWWEEIQRANAARGRGADQLLIGELLTLPVIDVDAPPAEHAAGGQTPASGGERRVTEFGTFEVYPDRFIGPLPQSAEGVQVVTESTFAEREQAALSVEYSPEVEWMDEDPVEGCVVITIAGEQVAVHNKAEAQHAQWILHMLRDTYGVSVDSEVGVKALWAAYDDVFMEELLKVQTTEWEYKELVAIERAFTHFAPLLGAKRELSTAAGEDQGVTTLSKLGLSISGDDEDGYASDDTIGQYFKTADNVTLFEAGEEYDRQLGDNMRQLEGTVVHELAHALLEHDVPDFVASMPYWKRDYEKSGAQGAEAPPSRYGQKDAHEDLSESVMFYFMDPLTLRTRCPERYAWIDALVMSWSDRECAQ
ncbi:MAG: LysM peptidoglycan-binding domain-containing protein [Deltaproteobacteria bacterium]|nr:LysM peptidoglycan-binding domain-containing protein [Deltaproteobacteria bacterium]